MKIKNESKYFSDFKLQGNNSLSTIRNSRTNKRRLGILVFLPSVVPVPNVAVGFISPAARAASNFDINIGNLEEYVINTESVLLLAHYILTAMKSKMHI